MSGVRDTRCYRLPANAYEHGETEGHRRLEIQSDINVPHYLRNGFQYFGEIFRICNLTNPLDDSSKLDQIVTSGKTFYEADMQSRDLSPY